MNPIQNVMTETGIMCGVGSRKPKSIAVHSLNGYCADTSNRDSDGTSTHICNMQTIIGNKEQMCLHTADTTYRCDVSVCTTIADLAVD